MITCIAADLGASRNIACRLCGISSWHGDDYVVVIGGCDRDSLCQAVAGNRAPVFLLRDVSCTRQAAGLVSTSTAQLHSQCCISIVSMATYLYLVLGCG